MPIWNTKEQGSTNAQEDPRCSGSRNLSPSALICDTSRLRRMLDGNIDLAMQFGAKSGFEGSAKKKLKYDDGDLCDAARKDEKPFVKFEKHAELLSAKAENAKLYLKLNSISQELAETKTRLFKEHEKFVTEKQAAEFLSKNLQRQISILSKDDECLKEELEIFKKTTDDEKSTLFEKIRTLETRIDEQQQGHNDILDQFQRQMETLEADLLDKRKLCGEHELKIEHLIKEIEFYKERNSELTKKLTENLIALSDTKRKFQEKEISMRRWREENQIATTIRYETEDLKRLSCENAALKERVQKCKYVNEDIRMMQQDKGFLEDEVARLRASIQRYIKENSELKLILSKTGSLTVSDGPASMGDVPSPSRPRQSLTEIDNKISENCAHSSEQLAEQLSLINSLKHELAQKDAIIQKLNDADKLNECKDTVAEKNNQVDYVLQRLGMKLDYDPQTTSIIRLDDKNPLDHAHSQYCEEINFLRKNNTILALRVEELEKLRLNEEGVLPFASDLANDLTLNVQRKFDLMKHEGHIDKLKAEIEKVTEQRDRVTKTFKEGTARYRKICAQLLGYEIKLLEGNSMIVVRSIYEPSTSKKNDERHFLIQTTDDGEYQLLENMYINEWKDDFVEMYLSNDNCFPAFFAAVTLQLYNKDKNSCD